MITDNLISLLQTIKQQLEIWIKLHLTQFGKVAVTKMNVLPRFIFVFLNLNNYLKNNY